jgi:hypothetical protein
MAARAEALFAAGPTEKVNGGTAAGTPPRLDFTVDVDTWYGIAGSALRLEPGRHTISLAPREAGLVLNQIALTRDSTPELRGSLPPSTRTA